jgi:hypothetical protein
MPSDTGGEQEAHHTLHPQLDSVVERCIRTAEEHLQKVVTSHQKDWGAGLPIFLLAYRTSTHDTTGFNPASLVFGRELRPPCGPLFGAPPDEEQPTFDHASNLEDHLPPTPEAGL